MTTWLTRITPDLRHRAAVADLDNIVALHKTIMRLFPADLGSNARSTAGVLFRAEQTPGGGIEILVQSNTQPDSAKLPEGYGTTVSRPLDPLLEAVRKGLPVRYRLVANATRKLGRNTVAGKPLTVIPLVGADAEAWWERQAEQSGLELREAVATPLPPAVGVRVDKARSTLQPQHHARTRFDGTATITDPALLRERMITGIGRAKTYGCGLLTLAPSR